MTPDGVDAPPAEPAEVPAPADQAEPSAPATPGRTVAERRAASEARALRLLPTTASKVALAVALVVYFALPLFVRSDFWVTVLVTAGVFAIGAIGLNLLTGYTGQVSLGHAFFIYVGVYCAAYLGTTRSWELFGVHMFDGRFPLVAWLPITAIIGAAVGAVVGPFALRFRGNYLVVVTLALVIIGGHLWDNWESVTGGNNGTSTIQVPLSVGAVDFADLEVAGKQFTKLQGLFYLTWALAGLALLVCRNIVRSRPGRAMQAIRDRDIAAEVVGVSLTRYKILAFAVAGAMAAVAGALFGISQQFVTPPGREALFLSIRYVAVLVVGGAGALLGPIYGAIALGPLPELLKEYSDVLPCWDWGGVHGCLVTQEGTPPRDGLVSVAAFNEILFGVLLVGFLMFEPRGVAGLLHRVGVLFRRRSRAT